MDLVKKLFYPSKKKLISFGLIILSSLFIIEGIIKTDIVTYDVEWTWWQNLLMYIFSLSNFFGSFFQSSYFFFAGLFPTSESNRASDILGIIINSYIQGCVIGLIWDSPKSGREKQLLWFYAGIWVLFSIGIFFTFFTATLLSFVVFIASVIGAGLIVNIFKKTNRRIFTPLLLLTVIFSIGAFYLSIHNFEDAYCWDKTLAQDFASMQCHETFNLIEAISETAGN